MKEIKPFSELKQGEMEVSKNECAIYLDLYYRFVKEILKYPNELYINIFKKVKYKDNDINLNVVNETSCYNEYDYMVQFAQFFTINKLFSIIIDSNIDYIDTSVSNDYIDEKYYVNGSNKFTKKNLIKLLRNALNHNDKTDFQLFRLIKSKSNVDLYVEIFLRELNMHLKIEVKDLFDIFGEVLNAKSIYDYKFRDQNGQQLIKIDDLMRELDNTIFLDLVHFYNFNLTDSELDDKVIHNISSDKRDEFIKSFELDDSQKKAAKNTFSTITKKHNQDCTFALPCILRDIIPFGMTKIYGYSYDINYFISELYNPKNYYNNYIQQLNSETFKNVFEEARAFYYSLINSDSVIDRSFSLFASYILDSVITDTEFVFNGNKTEKNYYRNAFVHGRWYSMDDGGKSLVLRDYEQGDDNIMTHSLNDVKEKVVNQEQLYHDLKKYLTINDYDLPLSLIADNSNNGYHITYRVNGTNYYCNMSLTNKAPIFLLLGEKNGQVFIASGNDFKLFEKEISDMKINELDPRELDYIKKMPGIVRKAFKTLLETNSDDEYKKKLSSEINKLLDICIEIQLGIDAKHPVIHYDY